MKFDELAKKAKEIKAPVLFENININKQRTDNMNTLADRLKKVDSKTRFSIRALQIFYIIMIFVFLIEIIIIDIEIFQYGLFFIIATFIGGIILQQRRYDKFNKTHTDTQVNKFLQNAKKRLNVFNNYYYSIPVWILFDVALCFFALGIFSEQNNMILIIFFTQVFLLIVIGLEILQMYITWKKKYKPVLDEIDKMIEEIEND